MNARKEHAPVQKIKKKLSPLFDDKSLKLVLLFGSAAQDRLGKQSDIDIGFLYREAVNILDLTTRVICLLGRDDVDVVNLGLASPLLKFSAARNGLVLFEDTPGVFHEFYSRAFREYADTQKLRDAQKRAIHIFLQERGVQ